MRPMLVAVTLGAVLSVASLSAGQSLAEVSRKAEAARQVTSGQPPAKVYTNQDVPVVVQPPPSPDSTPSIEPAAAAPETAPADAAPETSSPAANDEAYWRERMRPLRERLESARALADDTKRRAETLMRAADQCLAIGIVCADYTESVRLTDEHKALAAEVERAERDVVALEEEARRARALPGWLRK